MHRKRFALVAALVAALTAVAVSAAATTSTKSSKAVTLNLVAYSTPKPVMTKIISDFQETPEGLRRHDQRLVRSLDGAGEGGRSRACRRTSCSSTPGTT